MDWYPVAAWAQENEVHGYPWQLLTTLCLGTFGTTNSWEYLALTCHFVTGLRDRYEHTFDSWGRKEDDRHSWCEALLVTDYQVREAATALSVDVETADQFLMYRTLHSRLPAPLLEWFAVDAVRYEIREAVEKLVANGTPHPRSDEWNLAEYERLKEWQHGVLARDDALNGILRSRWRILQERAAAELEDEYAAEFRAPAPPVPFCDVSPDLTVTLHLGRSPADHAPTARFLDYALTANLLSWHELFAASGIRLVLHREGLAKLRAEMERDDVSGRVGTLDGGTHSDTSLCLLLRARLMNLVAPLGLWGRLGMRGGEVSEGEWRLLIPPECAAVHPRA